MKRLIALIVLILCSFLSACDRPNELSDIVNLPTKSNESNGYDEGHDSDSIPMSLQL